jgi:hypothetical protein
VIGENRQMGGAMKAWRIGVAAVGILALALLGRTIPARTNAAELTTMS